MVLGVPKAGKAKGVAAKAPSALPTTVTPLPNAAALGVVRFPEMAMDFITLLPPSFEGVANVADIPDYVHEA